MNKNYLKTYLIGLKIIGVLLSFTIPIVIYVSLINLIMWTDISWQRFILKKTPSIIMKDYYAEEILGQKDYNTEEAKKSLNLDLLPDKPETHPKFDPEKFKKYKLQQLNYSWDNAGILSMICFYVFIPVCLALYFPIIKFMVKSLKKSFKELRNE